MFRMSRWSKYLSSIVLIRKYWVQKTKYEHIWVLLNIIFAFFTFLELKFGIFKNYYSFHPFLPIIVWWIEFVVFVAFVLNALIHIYLYYWTRTAAPYVIPLSWKTLLNLPTEGDAGRHWICDEPKEDTSRNAQFLSGSHFRSSSWHYWNTFTKLPLRRSTALKHKIKPCPLRSDETLKASQPAFSLDLEKSPGFHRSPRVLSEREAFAQEVKPKMETTEDLRNYLIRHEEEMKKTKIMNRPLKNYKFFTPPGTVEHQIQVLQNHTYQQYSLLPSPLDNDAPSGCSPNVYSNYRVTEKMLHLWCERLRKWICQTIIVQLVDEFDNINKRLLEIGLSDLQIGVANLLPLQQLAFMKSQNLPTLMAVVPYLEASLNQEYLVQRMKELASGGCMKDYKWNGGGKTWIKEYPTDCAIIFHLFCTYLDSILPCDSRSGKKKSFSNTFIRKVPEKPVFEKGLHYIYKSKDDPVHYTVIIDEEVYGLPKGQSNLFAAISFFLHHIRMKENKVLGRVNLGPSGLNILWILD